MTSVFPSHKDIALSKDSLGYAEIMSDGLMHVASVFSIPHNERFIERVAAMGFMNGIAMQDRAVPPQVSTLQARLEASLPAESYQVMPDLPENHPGDKTILNHIRDYWGTAQVRRLDRNLPSTLIRARQIIATAVLQGLKASTEAPILGQHAVDLLASGRILDEVMCSRVWFWNICGDGCPITYPLLEPIGNYFFMCKPERLMVVEGIDRSLPQLVKFVPFWDFKHWTDAGCAWGQTLMHYRPEMVEQAWHLLPAEIRDERLAMRDSYRLATSPHEAFVAFQQGGLADSSCDASKLIASRPQTSAIEAFHFGIWCGAHDADFYFTPVS